MNLNKKDLQKIKREILALFLNNILVILSKFDEENRNELDLRQSRITQKETFSRLTGGDLL